MYSLNQELPTLDILQCALPLTELWVHTNFTLKVQNSFLLKVCNCKNVEMKNEKYIIINNLFFTFSILFHCVKTLVQNWRPLSFIRELSPKSSVTSWSGTTGFRSPSSRTGSTVYIRWVILILPYPPSSQKIHYNISCTKKLRLIIIQKRKETNNNVVKAVNYLTLKWNEIKYYNGFSMN